MTVLGPWLRTSRLLSLLSHRRRSAPWWSGSNCFQRSKVWERSVRWRSFGGTWRYFGRRVSITPGWSSVASFSKLCSFKVTWPRLGGRITRPINGGCFSCYWCCGFCGMPGNGDTICVRIGGMAGGSSNVCGANPRSVLIGALADGGMD